MRNKISKTFSKIKWVIFANIFMAVLFFSVSPVVATFYGPEPQPGLHEYQFNNGRYYIYLPAGYNQDGQYPLVVLSYSYIGVTEIEPREFMHSWKNLADGRNYIVVLPIGGGDVRFIDQWYKNLLETVKSSYAVDSSRILLTGFGAGGHYALHLGASNPIGFRAVSPVAGTWEGYWKDRTPFPKKNRPDFYFISGAEDTQASPKEVQQVAESMEKRGYSVRFEKLEGIGHAYSDQFTVKIADWFDSLSKR